jgi:hypothetical protein
MGSDDIENLLGRMPLRKPPASLDAKVLGAARPGRRIVLWGAAGAGLAAAAAAVILAVAGLGGPARTPVLPSPTQGVVAAEPVRVEEDWSQVRYEGIVVPDGRTPLKQFRRQAIEHVQWIDAASGTRTEMTIPREEVILIKASVD